MRRSRYDNRIRAKGIIVEGASGNVLIGEASLDLFRLDAAHTAVLRVSTAANGSARIAQSSSIVKYPVIDQVRSNGVVSFTGWDKSLGFSTTDQALLKFVSRRLASTA